MHTAKPDILPINPASCLLLPKAGAHKPVNISVPKQPIVLTGWHPGSAFKSTGKGSVTAITPITGMERADTHSVPAQQTSSDKCSIFVASSTSSPTKHRQYLQSLEGIKATNYGNPGDRGRGNVWPCSPSTATSPHLSSASPRTDTMISRILSPWCSDSGLSTPEPSLSMLSSSTTLSPRPQSALSRITDARRMQEQIDRSGSRAVVELTKYGLVIRPKESTTITPTTTTPTIKKKVSFSGI